MPKPLRILVALLACAALTTTPALAAPATAEATFEQALLNVPPLPAEGDLDFEQVDGGIKVKGVFRKGFTQEDPNEYRLVAVDDINKVIVDFTKDFAGTAEVAPPEVAEFEFTTKTKVEIADILNQEAVVYQVINVAGLKLLAEVGRAKIVKGEG